MFMFSRVFERMIQSREQEARRIIQSTLLISTREDTLSNGLDGSVDHTRDL